jgi:hypothetical protein
MGRLLHHHAGSLHGELRLWLQFFKHACVVSSLYRGHVGSRRCAFGALLAGGTEEYVGTLLCVAWAVFCVIMLAACTVSVLPVCNICDLLSVLYGFNQDNVYVAWDVGALLCAAWAVFCVIMLAAYTVRGLWQLYVVQIGVPAGRLGGHVGSLHCAMIALLALNAAQGRCCTSPGLSSAASCWQLTQRAHVQLHAAVCVAMLFFPAYLLALLHFVG